MNRAVQYPFFPIIDSFNTTDSISKIMVNNLEQVLPLFPSEIKIDSIKSENWLGHQFHFHLQIIAV